MIFDDNLIGGIYINKNDYFIVKIFFLKIKKKKGRKTYFNNF